MESLSNPNAPIARHRSAAELAAAPIALIRSNTVVIGRDGGCFRLCSTGRIGGDSTEASSSAVGIPLRTCAAAVAPAEVPITRSARSARSRPASARPAMTPISHAFPAAPPPPRTRARLWAACGGDVRRTESGPEDPSLPSVDESDWLNCDMSWSLSGHPSLGTRDRRREALGLEAPA